VLFVIAPLIVVTGIAQLPFSILHPSGAIFPGGVKLWHFALVAFLCAFVVGHVGMVVATGFVANVRGMLLSPPNAARERRAFSVRPKSTPAANG